VSAAKFAKKSNVAPVYNLAGSLLSWVHCGGPLHVPDTRQPTAQLHVYGPAWDLAPHHITTVMGGKQGAPLKVLTEGKRLQTDNVSADGGVDGPSAAAAAATIVRETSDALPAAADAATADVALQVPTDKGPGATT
jgi:hypothetical protein